MEKKLYDLTIDPELRDLIPPLSEEERRMLEDSIVRDGCDTPLTVWNGTIVDGHNRYEICHARGIPFAIEEKTFDDRDAAIFWMLERQLGRRNLNSYDASTLALRFQEVVRKCGKKNQGARTDLKPDLLQNFGERDTHGYSDRKMAEMAGVSRETIRKVRKINEAADADTRGRLHRGEISVHEAYTTIKNKEHENETRVCERCGEEKPCNDFRIPSNGANYSAICKACEAKAKQAARDAEAAAVMPPVEVTGMAVLNGKLAHVPTQLRDDPALFDHVLSLLRVAANAYIATCETAISKLQPSMMTPENMDTIRQMIDDTADTVDNILTRIITENGKEDM